jgi:hypothetical protein
MEKKRYVLRFFSGIGHGGSYVVTEGEHLIGRSRGLQLVLADDQVSRRHARLVFERDTLRLEDLGSQNGTFLNRRQVTSEVVGLGDWIRIGSSLIKVTDGSPDKDEGPLDTAITAVGSVLNGIRGSLEELPVSDLLQVVATSGKTRSLHLTSGRLSGFIRIRDGNLRWASIHRVVEDRPYKALYRMLSWSMGTFKVVGDEDASDAPAGPAEMEIRERLDYLLMDGMRQIDEARQLEERLGGLSTAFVIDEAAASADAEMSELERSALDLARAGSTLGEILDACGSADLEALVVVDALTRKQILSAAPPK